MLEGEAHTSLSLDCRTLTGTTLNHLSHCFCLEQRGKGHWHGGLFRDRAFGRLHLEDKRFY